MGVPGGQLWLGLFPGLQMAGLLPAEREVGEGRGENRSSSLDFIFTVFSQQFVSSVGSQYFQAFEYISVVILSGLDLIRLLITFPPSLDFKHLSSKGPNTHLAPRQ